MKDSEINTLTTLLAARQDLGYPPVILSFITCTITSWTVKKLEGASGVSDVYVHMGSKKMADEVIGSESDTDESSG